MAGFTSYADWAAGRSTKKIHTVEMTVVKVADSSTLDLFWTDDASERIDGWAQYCEPYLQSLPRVTHKASSVFSGSSLVSYGDLVLTMAREKTVDPAGHVTWNDLLSDYAFYGRPVTVRVGGPGLDYAQWGVVLAGYLGQPSWTDSQVTIPVYSKAKLAAEREVPLNSYDSGDAEGKAKPLCLGYCQSIKPVQTDADGLVYQFHDPTELGAVKSVDAVYVNGLAVTSGFTLDLSAGTITFAGDPSGTVTLDVQGAQPGGIYVELPGDLVKAMLIYLGGVASGDIDTAAFTAYNTAVPYQVGIYITSKMKLSRAIDSLLSGLLTFWGTTRAGLWTIQRFTEPSGEPVAEFTDVEILEDSFSVDAEDTLLYKMTIQGNRCWTTDTNPAESVSADRREWLAEQFRQREAVSSATQSLFPDLAQTDSLETHLVDLDDCAAVAQWWLDLFGQRRFVANIAVKMQGVAVELGQVVRITSEAPMLSGGQLARVTSITENHGQDNKVNLEAWL